MRLLLLSLILLSSSLMTTACSPVQGYPGPARPDTEVSIIKTSADSNLSLSNEYLSGVEIGYSGIAMLPGPQEYSGLATLAGEPYNCRPYTDFNSYGYHDCQKQRRKNNQYDDCDCFDYLTVHQKCDQVVKEGNCRASFITVAGARYELRAGMNAGTPAIVIRDMGTGKDIGSGKCDKVGQRTETVDQYVGTGRYEANRIGVYSCWGY